MSILIKIFYKSFVITFLAILFSHNHFPQPEFRNSQSAISELQNKINMLIDDRFFESAAISIDVFDLTDSIPLFQYNNNLLLHPASNLKILTSIAALLNLGADYEFKTELYHTGVISGVTLYGDLYIVGGFDPDFTTKELDSLVQTVKSLGIQYIVGGIYADVSKKDSLYWGSGWMWDDDPGPGAPYLSALNINDNSIEVLVEGSRVDSPAVITLIPQTDFVQIVNNAVTVPFSFPGDFEVTRDWVNRTNKIIVDGTITEGEIIDSSNHIEKINLLNPEMYFLTLFKEHLIENGIYIDKGTGIRSLPGNSVYLYAINRSIDSVLVDLNKESDNLNAEMLVYAIALNDSGAPATAENGIEAIYGLIDSAGFDQELFSIVDGSGVSHYNLVSAELILELLKFAHYNLPDLFELFYNSLAVAGVDGTLEKRMLNTPAENNLRGKTGTLSGVSNLSGYLTAENGNLIAFSVMIQNFVGKHSTAREFQDKICVLLAEYK